MLLTCLSNYLFCKKNIFVYSSIEYYQHNKIIFKISWNPKWSDPDKSLQYNILYLFIWRVGLVSCSWVWKGYSSKLIWINNGILSTLWIFIYSINSVNHSNLSLKIHYLSQKNSLYKYIFTFNIPCNIDDFKKYVWLGCYHPDSTIHSFIFYPTYHMKELPKSLSPTTSLCTSDVTTEKAINVF